MNQLNPLGKKFGRLTPIRRIGRKGGPLWLWQCDCGNTKEAVLGNVMKGSTSSCGCLRRELGRVKIYKAVAAVITHGESRGGKSSAELTCCAAMRQHCLDKNVRCYP